MRLTQLKLRDFRCFEEAQLELDPALNWIVGQNASGKTSLLEALFFLGHGRSFRSGRTDRLIRAGAGRFEVVALLDQGKRHVLGMGRAPGVTEARFAGEPLRSMADAAKILPVVVLDSGITRLISGGPSERRRWLDWGVFHVEHDFLPLWRGYQQALRQRNEALRSGVSERTLSPWSQAVARAGESLSGLRQNYFEAVTRIVKDYAQKVLPGVVVDVDYQRGWPTDESLEESLARHVARDRESGNTRSGPHRADVQLKIGSLPAEERLSRGQQKSLAGAFWLAQVNEFNRHAGRNPVLLVDDLAAELDVEHLARFLSLLEQQKAQKVLTAIGDSEISKTGLTSGKVFHVEHGTFR